METEEVLNTINKVTPRYAGRMREGGTGERCVRERYILGGYGIKGEGGM